MKNAVRIQGTNSIKSAIFAAVKYLSLGLGLTLILASTLPKNARAETVQFQLDEKKSPVSFLAVGKPGFLRIKGQGGSVAGTAQFADGEVSGTFTVNLTEFKTGIDLRDQHMKEKYLETPKFPVATLEVSVLKSGKNSEGLPDYQGDFDGKLTLKGKTKPVHGHLKLTGKDGQVEGDAKLKISLNDFDVGVPSHLGVTVAHEVEISVQIRAAKIQKKAI